VVRIVALGTINAVSIWAVGRLVSHQSWLAAACLVLATAAIDAVYLTRARRAVPYKYLVPGTVFLLAFQVYPVLYTAYLSTTNLGTGNVLDKEAATDQVVATSVGSTSSETSLASRSGAPSPGKPEGGLRSRTDSC
jgi:arabinogalactan oligomer/maltooligosaccharide transport system permease protein